MKSAVLAAIGDEILGGARLEKNCNFMARALHNIGCEVKRIEVVSDEESEILSLLSRWIGNTDLLIVSGGLGPTHDDKTRYAIAKYLGSSLRDNALYDKILERVKDDPERLARLERTRNPQAMIPESSQAVYNPTGSALGIKFTLKGTTVISLPGVPMEYESMVRQELPEVFSPVNKNYAWASVIILGLPEMSIAAKIPEVINDSGLHVSILPAFPQVELIIRGEPERVDNAERLTRSRFDYVLPRGCYSPAEAVLYESCMKDIKIACAESCTGGMVASALTDIAGSSQVFNGSCVTYSNEAKMKILGVKDETLKAHGAVSSECAIEMAEGALRVYNSDYAVSTTGIAGPDGGSESKPVGTVWFGLASRKGESHSFMKILPGNRGEVRTRAVRFALCELWKAIHTL